MPVSQMRVPAAWVTDFVAGCLLLSGLTAQTFTVGGAAPDYPDLQSAVAAVPPGAVLQVRAGKYRGFTTGKPLRIRLEFTGAEGAIEAPPGAAHAVVITGLPAFTTFALVGDAAVVTGGSLGAIRVANTAGSVFLSGLDVAAGLGVAVDVQDAAPVHVHATRLRGAPGLQVQNALLVGNDVHVTATAGSAVAALQATLDLTRGGLAGREQPALQLTDCTTRLTGDGTTVCKVGGPTTLPVPVVSAQGGQLAWQPSRFLLVPANGAGAVATAGTVVLADDGPSLTVRGGPPGAPGSIRLQHPVPLPAVTIVAPYAFPVFFGPAAFWVDLGQPYTIASVGIADPNGLVVVFTMPTSPALLGDVSCVQGAVFATVFPTLSGPAPLLTL